MPYKNTRPNIGGGSWHHTTVHLNFNALHGTGYRAGRKPAGAYALHPRFHRWEPAYWFYQFR
jgi:hypothetical protein